MKKIMGIMVSVVLASCGGVYPAAVATEGSTGSLCYNRHPRVRLWVYWREGEEPWVKGVALLDLRDHVTKTYEAIRRAVAVKHEDGETSERSGHSYRACEVRCPQLEEELGNLKRDLDAISDSGRLSMSVFDSLYTQLVKIVSAKDRRFKGMWRGSWGAICPMDCAATEVYSAKEGEFREGKFYFGYRSTIQHMLNELCSDFLHFLRAFARYRLEQKKLTEAERLGMTLLQFAYSGKSKEIKDLVACGVDINFVDTKGRTALHYAARGGREEAIRVLLEAGADKKLPDHKGRRPCELVRPWASNLSGLLAVLI